MKIQCKMFPSVNQQSIKRLITRTNSDYFLFCRPAKLLALQIAVWLNCAKVSSSTVAHYERPKPACPGTIRISASAPPTSQCELIVNGHSGFHSQTIQHLEFAPAPSTRTWTGRPDLERCRDGSDTTPPWLVPFAGFSFKRSNTHLK